MYAAHEVHYAPHVQKLVAEAPLHLDDGYPRVALPEPSPVTMELGDAIRARASRREFAASSLPLAHLSALLRLGNGVGSTHDVGGRPVSYRRAAANSGGLGSVEVYPVVLDVAELDSGMYHYDSVRHELSLLRTGDFRDWLREVVFFQLEFPEAAVAFALTGAIWRLRAKYGLRGYRFALLDAGHVSENFYLVATAFDLQVRPRRVSSTTSLMPHLDSTVSTLPPCSCCWSDRPGRIRLPGSWASRRRVVPRDDHQTRLDEQPVGPTRAAASGAPDRPLGT